MPFHIEGKEKKKSPSTIKLKVFIIPFFQQPNLIGDALVLVSMDTEAKPEPA